MENEKWKVPEFAELIGCSQKTVYALIKRKQLNAVNEMRNGRKQAFISASNEQIEELKKAYGNLQPKEVDCKETFTNEDYIEGEIVDTSNQKTDFINQLILLSNAYNEKIDNVHSELMKHYEQHYEEMLKKDKQILLLESSENRTKQDILETQAENKTLKLQLEKLKITLIILITITITVSLPVMYILLKHFIH